MSDLHQLLDVQELDLRADVLGAKRAGLPERDARTQRDVQLASLVEARSAIQVRRDEIGKEERSLGVVVEGVAAKAKDVETTLYSGSVTAPKELEALSEEIRLLKARQSELEDGELELLEGIEGIEAELAENDTRRGEIEAQAVELDAAIAAREAEIDAELAELANERSALVTGLPAPVLAAYDKLRAQPRVSGRAAARLSQRSCDGCRVDLPVMDVSRIREEPWDVVVACVHCSRILVR